MKTLGPEARRRNKRSRPRAQYERCHDCGDSGYVLVVTRSEPWAPGGGFEEVGPCPFCEQGFAEEFADPSKQTNSRPVGAPWGEEGFWKGRDPVEIVALEPSGNAPLPEAENMRRAGELLARLRGVGEEMVF